MIAQVYVLKAFMLAIGVVAASACSSPPAVASPVSDLTTGAADADAGATGKGDATSEVTTNLCKGQTCSGLGTCKIGTDGKPICDCSGPSCLYPTADLKCLSAAELCTEAALSCEGGSQCAADDDLTGCTCDATHIHKALCICPNGAKLDGDKCISDAASCQSLQKCVPSKGERWKIEVSGGVSLVLIDRKEFGGGQEWTAPGNLTLFNVWPKELCGAFKIANGKDLKVGSYDVGDLSISFALGGKQYNSTKVGAGGKVEVKVASWCDQANCTQLDLSLDVDLGGFDGTTVHLKGVVKGADF